MYIHFFMAKYFKQLKYVIKNRNFHNNITDYIFLIKNKRKYFLKIFSSNIFYKLLHKHMENNLFY